MRMIEILSTQLRVDQAILTGMSALCILFSFSIMTVNHAQQVEANLHKRKCHKVSFFKSHKMTE